MPSTLHPAPESPAIDFAQIQEVADAPDGPTTPYTMEVGDIFTGTASPAGDEDWVAITLTAGTTYTINLTGAGLPNGLTDPFLSLIDTDGTSVLLTNDDSGGGLNSRLTFTPTTTGTYYLEARGLGSSTGDYALTVTDPGTDASHETMVNYLVNGYWEDTGRNAHAFDTSASNQITVDITELSADGQQLARWAFEAWENVANIDFVEVNGGAQITFDDAGSGLSAGAGYSATGTTTNSSNIIITEGWLTQFGTTIGSYSLQTYIHEIGHSLGLGHLGNYNGSAVYGTDEDFRNDSWASSIMSYFSQSENTVISNTYARLVGAGTVDIGAIQHLYGASTGGFSAGDTVWGYNSNISGYMGNLFAAMLEGTTDPSVFGGPVSVTVHDTGGTDTLDFSGETVGMTLNLMQGAWSTIDSFRGTSGTTPVNNLTISYGSVIENAIGGSGNDAITGNSAANSIMGMNGNDSIDGGAGNDTLNGGNNNDTLLGGAGADELHGGNQEDRLYGGADNDRMFGGTGFDSLWGDSGDDFMRGGGQADNLFGGTGNDTMYGDQGFDRLFGGDDNDLAYGGAGTDGLFGQVGNDRLYGQQDSDRIFGGIGNDLLDGGSDNDFLFGGAGFDTLVGGTGNDELAGNFNADTFIFADFGGGFGQDTITDFDATNPFERIDLSRVASITDLADLQANHMTQVGADVVIDALGGNTITLLNVNLGDLDGTDFVF